MTIKDYSSTAASNTAINGVSIAGTAPVSNMDDGLRNVMADISNWTDSDTLASGSTTDLGSVAGMYVTVSGTATITGFGTLKAGMVKFVYFSGAGQITYNATSMILPGAANITRAAGDTAVFVSEGSGNWRCVSYQRSGGAGGLRSFQIFTSSGTWTKPAGCTAVLVEVCGGGGGGRGPSNTTGSTGVAAGGGGAGGYARKFIDVSSTSSVTVTVGTGGAGGSGGGNNGSAGNTSSFGTNCSAGGGAGGTNAGGSGGSGTDGDINLRGQNGGHRTADEQGSGYSGHGGNSYFGGGGYGFASGTNVSGTAGTFGGGGGGGRSGGAGGDGGAGLVVVWEFY